MPARRRRRLPMRRRARVSRRSPGRIQARRMMLPVYNLSAYAGRPFPGLPKTKRVNMRYVDSIFLDAAPGTIAKHVFRANSIQDPDQTGGGHNPLGFAQWQVFYNHYIVDKATITVNFTPTDANQDGQICGIYLSDDLTIPTTALEILEQGLSTWKAGPLATNSTPSNFIVKNSFNAKSMFNIKDIKDNFSRLGANFADNPTEVAFFTMFTQSLNNLADPGSLFCLVTIDYSVIMSEPKSLPQS